MAAQLRGLGRTLVAVPGTPVQVQVPATISPASCHACIIEALPGNTGLVYIGTTDLNRTTLANTLVVLPIPTANLIPAFSISVAGAANGISLLDLWIDSAIANDGVLISVIIA